MLHHLLPGRVRKITRSVSAQRHEAAELGPTIVLVQVTVVRLERTVRVTPYGHLDDDAQQTENAENWRRHAEAEDTRLQELLSC